MSASLLDHFRMMARYNARANRILYEACAQLSDAERQQVRPAFFKSIHGTLNHILLGDRVWLARFEDRTMPATSLDRILYEDFAELRSAREAEDRRLADFMYGLAEAFLDRTFRYVNHQGRDIVDEARVLLAHLFNHQTHHRGQVHDQLRQAAVPPPSLDLHRVINP